MCDITGRDYYHNDVVNKNPPKKNKDNDSSKEKTQNFNDGNNIIVLDNNNTTFRGLSGDDVYIISHKTDNKNAKITVVDTNGTNIIQVVNNVYYDSKTQSYIKISIKKYLLKRQWIKLLKNFSLVNLQLYL